MTRHVKVVDVVVKAEASLGASTNLRPAEAVKREVLEISQMPVVMAIAGVKHRRRDAIVGVATCIVIDPLYDRRHVGGAQVWARPHELERAHANIDDSGGEAQ